MNRGNILIFSGCLRSSRLTIKQYEWFMIALQAANHETYDQNHVHVMMMVW